MRLHCIHICMYTQVDKTERVPLKTIMQSKSTQIQFSRALKRCLNQTNTMSHTVEDSLACLSIVAKCFSTSFLLSICIVHSMRLNDQFSSVSSAQRIFFLQTQNTSSQLPIPFQYTTPIHLQTCIDYWLLLCPEGLLLCIAQVDSYETKEFLML